MKKIRINRWELAMDSFIFGSCLAMWPIATSAGVEFGQHWATIGHWFLGASMAMNLFNGVERIAEALFDAIKKEGE